MMNETPQRRQPVSYTELQEVLRTGVLPLMTDAVKHGEKPFCYNCVHWTNGEPQGVCANREAVHNAPMAKLDFGGTPVRLLTGALSVCDLHQMDQEP